MSKEIGLHSWSAYKKFVTEHNDCNLPPNPVEMYDDFTNWDKEFGIDDEYVW